MVWPSRYPGSLGRRVDRRAFGAARIGRAAELHLLGGVLQFLAALLHVALHLLAATLGGEVGISRRLASGFLDRAGRTVGLVGHSCHPLACVVPLRFPGSRDQNSGRAGRRIFERGAGGANTSNRHYSAVRGRGPSLERWAIEERRPICALRSVS